jgi:DNA polymerase-3 subunit delta'
VSWTRVRGHESLVKSFQRVIQAGRLGHAYLFAGPEGIGKRLFAIELAKALLCEAAGAAERLDGCDHCPACTQIEAGTHPDFQIVGLPEDKHEFPISLMQELIRHLGLKPARGKHRVAIIDDADDLNEEAANCFLKTLEEPPPRSLLILVGTSPERQYPTILSRCQVIRFALLPPALIAELLRREGVSEEALQLVRLSRGSLGDARQLADPAVSRFRRELSEALSQPRLSSVALAEKVVRFSEEGGKESAAKRQRGRLALRFIIELLRTALHVQQSLKPALSDASEQPAATALARRVSEDRLLRALSRCLEADYQVDRRLQLVLVLEAVVDSITQTLQPATT